jgi:hypothetical protein
MSGIVTDEMVDRAMVAFDAASSEPRLIECKRCSGKGYHHGFGEHGQDPDWCEDCGGGGFGLADGEERRPIIEALEAALALVPHPPEGGMDAGEPVAWIYEIFSKGYDPQSTPPNYAYWERRASVEFPTSCNARNVAPLYASPIPARDTARAEGVTDDIVERAAAAYWLAAYGKDRSARKWPDDVHGGSADLIRLGCRAALRAALTAPVRAAEVKVRAVAENIVSSTPLSQKWKDIVVNRIVSSLSLSPGLGEKDRIAELEKALEPFASLGKQFNAAPFPRPDEWNVWGFNDVNLTYGDFRRAVAALTKEDER